MLGISAEIKHSKSDPGQDDEAKDLTTIFMINLGYADGSLLNGMGQVCILLIFHLSYKEICKASREPLYRESVDRRRSNRLKLIKCDGIRHMQ